MLTATNGPKRSASSRSSRSTLLLDYFMPGMTGEQVVAELRKFDPFVQVILQTGYASEQPPRELLHRLNIQGYYDKTEGPEQLSLDDGRAQGCLTPSSSCSKAGTVSSSCSEAPPSCTASSPRPSS